MFQPAVAQTIKLQVQDEKLFLEASRAYLIEMAKYNLSHQAGNVGICINKTRAVWFKATQCQDWIPMRLVKDAFSGAVLLVCLAASDSAPCVSGSSVNSSHLRCLPGKQSGYTPPWTTSPGSHPTVAPTTENKSRCSGAAPVELPWYREEGRETAVFLPSRLLPSEQSERRASSMLKRSVPVGCLKRFSGGRCKRPSLPSLQMLPTSLPRLSKCSRANLFAKALMWSKELGSEVGSQICALPLTDTQNSNKKYSFSLQQCFF